MRGLAGLLSFGQHPLAGSWFGHQHSGSLDSLSLLVSLEGAAKLELSCLVGSREFDDDVDKNITGKSRCTSFFLSLSS